MTDTNPTIDAAKAVAKARFDAAIAEVTRFIGTCVMAGQSDQDIVDQLHMMKTQISRDSAIESTRPELNAFTWVLDEAIEKITETRLTKPGKPG